MTYYLQYSIHYSLLINNLSHENILVKNKENKAEVLAY
jgi:hypothetical protein